MTITILGTGYASCKALFANAQAAVAQLGLDAVVNKEEDIVKIMEYNVMALPAMVVDGKVVAKGRVLNVDQIKELLA